MLLNLVSNSIKFTPCGGKVQVKSKLIRSEQDFSVADETFLKIFRSSSSRMFLEIQVQDTGIGIKEEEKPMLFQLFGFLDSSRQINSKGIGLGLHITKKIAQMFHGDIICQSEHGQGSNFIFIVALGNGTENASNNISNSRIRNTILKTYNKIQINIHSHRTNIQSMRIDSLNYRYSSVPDINSQI